MSHSIFTAHYIIYDALYVESTCWPGSRNASTSMSAIRSSSEAKGTGSIKGGNCSATWGAVATVIDWAERAFSFDQNRSWRYSAQRSERLRGESVGVWGIQVASISQLSMLGENVAADHPLGGNQLLIHKPASSRHMTQHIPLLCRLLSSSR